MTDRDTADVLARIDETLAYASWEGRDAMRWGTTPPKPRHPTPFYRAEIRQGIGGTVVAQFAFTRVAIDAQRVAVDFQAHIDQFAAVFQQAGDAIARFAGQLRDAGLLLEELPKDPKDPRARALWLRQHRNTGPAHDWRAR
jgi:hypothetical protein